MVPQRHEKRSVQEKEEVDDDDNDGRRERDEASS